MNRNGRLSRRCLALLCIAGFLGLLFSILTAAQVPCPGAVLAEDGRLHGLGLRDVDTSRLDPARKAPPMTPRGPLRAIVDNSAGLPPVGDQGNQGSCGAWSVGYYIKTYIEGKEHGWDVNTPAHQFSPAYIYNQARIPDDGGMWFNDTMKLVEQLGCPTLSTMPYNDADHTSWPPEDAYKEALRYRTALHHWIGTAEAGALDQVKAHVDGGSIGLLAIDIWGNFDSISSYGFNYCVADRTGNNRGGHAVTVVGYDDGRVTHDGVGAFRCVNQWGTGWGDSGFFWISYQAVTDAAHKICQGWYGYMDEIAPDEPTYAARFQLSYSRFRALYTYFISGGSVYEIFKFQSYMDSMNLAVDAPPNPIWIDISQLPHPEGLPVELRTQNEATTSGVSGQITLFELVRLSDDARSSCNNVPITIPASGSEVIASAPFTFGAPCTVTCTATVPATAEPGMNVTFHATATASACAGTPTFLWNFGDGVQSNTQDGVHSFAVGTYNWSLTVTVDGQTCTRSGSIVVAGASQCSITCDTFIYPDSGPAPLAVSFDVYPILSDCTGSASSHWTFGDGGSADGESVTHTYVGAGIFTWTVTVTTDGKTCTQTGSVSVTSDCELTCTASAAPASGTAPLAVSFSGSATLSNCTGDITYDWAFGDGSVSIEQNPVHTYSLPGTYSWTLVAAFQTESCKKDGTVTVTAPGGKPGDCDGNGTVSIGEVQKAINMFLGIQAVGCGVDCNGDGTVSIGEVQKVINAFLGAQGSC